MADEGLDFFRGLLIAAPLGAAMWVGLYLIIRNIWSYQ